MIDYLKKKAELESEIKALKKLINQYSFSRLLFFGIDILFIYVFFNQGITAIIFIVILSLLGFMFLVKKHVKYQLELSFLNTKKLLVENEINIKDNVINIYSNGECFCNPTHPYTDDLDVFGAHSLFQYINRCATNESQFILANFLKETSSKKQIEERQIAVEELSHKTEDFLNFRTRLFDVDKSEISTIETFFKDFLSNKLNFLNNSVVNILILLTPLLSISMLILAIVFNGILWNIFGLILLLSGVCYMFFKQKIDLIHEQIGKNVNGLKHYAENIKWIENEEWKSILLTELKTSLKKKELISQEIFSLSKILNSLNSRLNPIVGLFLNLFFQWDLRTLKRLAKWEIKNKEEIINAFDVLFNFEALISFATFSANHSTWIYPKIYEHYHFNAESIGHPLINEKVRVNNDFNLAKNITIDVITGSNMAGKSTFLRTVGINMVLAYAGAKVCAKNMETSIFSIISYMRIKDSLANQTSTFKAEIDRLKMILDFTQSHQNSFVLIDEMLRGTNSKDKYLGSKVFIKKLIAQNTPGFIATHDLQIAELEKEYPIQLRNFHFDITIQNQEMFFDYKIKNGECKTFNASILLKAIGIEIEG
jgi:DNA mismatch repair ATPase MutS